MFLAPLVSKLCNNKNLPVFIRQHTRSLTCISFMHVNIYIYVQFSVFLVSRSSFHILTSEINRSVWITVPSSCCVSHETRARQSNASMDDTVVLLLVERPFICGSSVSRVCRSYASFVERRARINTRNQRSITPFNV